MAVERESYLDPKPKKKTVRVFAMVRHAHGRWSVNVNVNLEFKTPDGRRVWFDRFITLSNGVGESRPRGVLSHRKRKAARS